MTHPVRISEADLVSAYLAPNLEARPCQCGSVVIADPRDPAKGVELHQQTEAHQFWRWRRGL